MKLNSKLDGFKIYAITGQYTPDTSGRIAIDVSALNATTGYVLASTSGTTNIIARMSVYANNNIVVYVSNMINGDPFTSKIYLSIMLFYK